MNKQVLFVVLLASLCLLLGACGRTEAADDPATGGEFQPSADQESVPYPQYPVVDGSLDPEEWQGAQIHIFEDGSQLFLLPTPEHLYLAIVGQGEGMIAGNVFLLEGDRIRVLHTSAALGSVVYEQSGSQWERVKDFAWCCRARIDAESGLAAREDLYRREGWLGANSFLGAANVLEYQILLEAEHPFLAVNFLLADDPDVKQAWPLGLGDGVTWPASEGFPQTMDFQPDTWFDLELGQ